MKVYLDIEGTLIGPDGHPAKGLEDFLNYATAEYECYWLSFFSRTPADNPIAHLATRGVTEATILAAAKVNDLHWDRTKAEAINLKEDFVWFDDMPSTADMVILEKNRVRSRWYEINLKKNQNALYEALDWLMSLQDD
jgi:hypothetical protein